MNRSNYSFGEIFHTSLRTGSDTTFSVLLWNICTATDNLIWTLVMEFCQNEWNNGSSPTECLEKAFNNRNYFLKDYYDQSDRTKSEERRRDLNIFLFACHHCDSETKKDIDNYFNYVLDNG